MCLLLFLSAFSLIFRLLFAQHRSFTCFTVFGSIRAIYEFLAAHDAFFYIRRFRNRHMQLFVLRQHGASEPFAKHRIRTLLRAGTAEYKAMSVVIVAARFLYQRPCAAELFGVHSRQAHSSRFGGSFCRRSSPRFSF